MAGYPKIWTRIRYRTWFRDLGLAQRGIWYEVIMIAKEQTDDGWVCFSNATGMASELNTNRTSIETWIARESQANRISDVQKGKRYLRFYITEYNRSQQVKSQKELKKGSLIRGKGRKGNIREAEVEYVGNLKALKIDKSILQEFKKDIPGIDHDDELKSADLYRLDKPSKSQNPNDHLFLKNWFKRARKGKDGEEELSKYNNI